MGWFTLLLSQKTRHLDAQMTCPRGRSGDAYEDVSQLYASKGNRVRYIWQYTVDDVKYEWVSTYSYRGWCSLLQTKLKACVPKAPGYNGDREWAVCDAAPCTKIQNPSNPDRPLTCQCGIEKTPFVGTNGSCTGDNGGIMSSMPL